jgi:hypothetical protein
MDNSMDFWPMVILMIVFSYFIMSNVMLTFKNGFYNHVNKTYMALLMGSLMGVIYYILMLWRGHQTSEMWYGLMLWIIISLVFILLIRKQTLINDKEFLKGMTEHHDMALQMSSKIMEKTTDQELAQFANHIIQTQQTEINWMKQKLAQKY